MRSQVCRRSHQNPMSRCHGNWLIGAVRAIFATDSVSNDRNCESWLGNLRCCLHQNKQFSVILIGDGFMGENFSNNYSLWTETSESAKPENVSGTMPYGPTILGMYVSTHNLLLDLSVHRVPWGVFLSRLWRSQARVVRNFQVIRVGVQQSLAINIPHIAIEHRSSSRLRLLDCPD